VAGVSLDVNLRGDVRISNKLRSAQAKLRNMADLMNGIGVLVEAQTKRRLMDEKTAPDGSRWEPWSDDYAKTRGPQHSLLIGHQDLFDSIEHFETSSEVSVGSDKAYANRQNHARQFLGLSKDNKDEILQVVDDWLDGLL